MQFDSINDFLAMGGYGFYVWISYGVTALALVLLIILSKQKHKQVLQNINQRYIRENKRKEAAKQQELNNQHSKQEEVTSSKNTEKNDESTP